MRNASALTFALLLALAGCKQQHQQTSAPPAAPSSAATASAQPQASPELTPEQLGELGAQIRKTPDHASDLLTQHGLTPQSFEAQIRKVAENPDAAKRYAEAYRKAGA